jgi:diguanylate cyclase (GGDEF)-like protein
MVSAPTVNRSDQFEWLSAYLQLRGLRVFWRRAMFGLTASLGAVALILLWSPAGPDRPWSRAVLVIASTFGVGAAILWLLHWPTRRQSILYSLGATVVIAACCLTLSNPYLGLLDCPMFAMLGGFIAYFHNARYTLLNLGAFAVCAGILSFRLITTTGDVASTGACVLTMTALNVGMPIGIHLIVKSLRDDLRVSERDPLTDLHNRRSFYNSVYELMTLGNHSSGRYLVFAMIDIDNFKRLNDTLGHAVGDQALVAVAAALRENCRPTAVICRCGGEEFVIADIGTTPTPAKQVERLREAIAALHFGVTASIGTYGIPLDTCSAVDMQLIDELIRASDTAMYEAKHAGGDQVCHHTKLAAPGHGAARVDQ